MNYYLGASGGTHQMFVWLKPASSGVSHPEMSWQAGNGISCLCILLHKKADIAWARVSDDDLLGIACLPHRAVPGINSAPCIIPSQPHAGDLTTRLALELS